MNRDKQIYQGAKMDVNQASISRRIRDLKIELNLNQKQFAELLGVTQPAVSKYLKDRIPPPLVLLRLASTAKTTIEWILTGIEDKSLLKVAEPVSTYKIDSKLDAKISFLPLTLQKRIEDLLNEILKNIDHQSGPMVEK
jgi:transcriptional regulator with XRE-family HTH domain